jgi:hypothetical protein
MRMTADVSAVADSVASYDSYDNGCTPPNCWYSEFGTSVATPIVASVYALAGILLHGGEELRRTDGIENAGRGEGVLAPQRPHD